MSGRGGADRNASHTAYLGGLDAQVTEELVWELMVQAGPVGACDDLPRCETNGWEADRSACAWDDLQPTCICRKIG